MDEWIDKNKLSLIRKNIDKATINDLKYAFHVNNMEAVFLLFDNMKIRRELYQSCNNLTRDEKLFLLQVDPKDIANVINNMTI